MRRRKGGPIDVGDIYNELASNGVEGRMEGVKEFKVKADVGRQKLVRNKRKVGMEINIKVGRLTPDYSFIGKRENGRLGGYVANDGGVKDADKGD